MDLFNSGQDDTIISSFEKVMESRNIHDFKSRLRAFPCKRCNLSNEIKQFPTTSRGNPDAKIVLVGEAPGFNELEQGIPFVGRGGQLMDELFKSVGIITNNDVYVSNICRCRPPDNRTPLKKEALTCIDYLKHEISIIKPDIILTMGQTSSKYLLGDIIKGKAMAEIVGQFYQSPEFKNIDFYILYHPAALLYNAKLKPTAIEHLKNLKEHLVNKGVL